LPLPGENLSDAHDMVHHLLEVKNSLKDERQNLKPIVSFYQGVVNFSSISTKKAVLLGGRLAFSSQKLQKMSRSA